MGLPTTEVTMSVKSLRVQVKDWGGVGVWGVQSFLHACPLVPPVLPALASRTPGPAAPKLLQLPPSPPWQAVPGPAGLSSHHLLLTPHGTLAPAPDLCGLPSRYSRPIPTPSPRRGPSSPPEVTWGESGDHVHLVAHLWY